MRNRTIQSALAAGAMCLIGACQDPSTAPVDDPAPSGPLAAGAPQSVALVAKHAVLGFRASGGSFSAGYATHDALVRDGIVELTPHHVTDVGDRVTGGAMGLETGYIERADGTQLGGRAQASVVAGAVQLRRGGVVETIENREDGIEQAWRFAAAPAGEGDLAIGVTVTGQTLAAATPTGLHFTSAAGLGFRYGNATWIDARGTETPIAVRFADGHVQLTVPADVLATTQYPAVLDPQVNAETAVDSPVNGGSGPGAVPSVAFDGTNYLVVWADSRVSTDDDIYATRVSAAGAVLDATNIKIAASAGVQTNPTVVFAGSQYIVAWEDYKVAAGTEADIAAATVSPAGVVAQLGAVANTAANETQPHLAASGAGALLAWNSGGASINAAAYGGSFGAPVSIGTGTVQDPAVAGSAAGYLVAFSSGTASAADLEGQLVTTAGALSGVNFPISNGAGRQFLPAATFDGTNYALAWTQNSGGVNLFAGRVSTVGALLDGATGIAVSTAAGNQQNPSIACPTTGCLIAWQDTRTQTTTGTDVFAQLMTPAFALSGANFAISALTQNQVRPAIATNGTDFFTAWQDRRDDSSDSIYGARVSAAGGVVDPNGIPLVRGNNRETTPSVGRLGPNNYVFWADSRNDSTDIELVRFSGGGSTKLDATARPISAAPLAQTSPAASATVTGNLFAVWADTRNGIDQDIYGTRVDSTGAALDPAGLAISTAAADQFVPAVATNKDGSVVLVVWEDGRNSAASGFDIYGALLDGSGAVIANDIVICNAAGEQNRPAVTFDSKNNQFVAVWSDQRVAGDANVFGARIDLTGAVLDANGVQITSAIKGQLQPDIAFTPSNWLLVVWEDRRTDSQGDIYGARLQAGAALTVLDPSGIAISAVPNVAQGGASVGGLANGGWLVAWTDSRTSATTGTDIYGTQVIATGAADPDFAISANVEDESNVRVGDATTPAYTRVAYVKKRPDLETQRVEARYIHVTNTGTGSSCTTDAQCPVTGFCVDKKCCNAACGGNDLTDCQACAGSMTGLPDGICAPIKANTVCRNYADTFCDLVERCDGTATTCPDDLGRRAGVACTITGGGAGHCPANDATGSPHVCQ